MREKKESTILQLRNMRESARNRLIKKWGLSYVFLAPALILLVLFIIYPAARSVYLSLFKWNGIGTPEFIGLKNYQTMFKAPAFWRAVQHSFTFTFWGTALSCFVGLCLALAIERRVKGWKFYKFTFYISVMLSVSVVSILFIQILEPNYGILNKLLETIGLEELTGTWLSNPDRAMGVVVAASTWQYSGFTMLLFLAAMEGIDPSIHEAATLDGISEMKRIFHITLPLIKRTIFVVIMLQIIFSMKSFDIFWVMTAGGPGDVTETMTTILYRNAMNFGKYGYASAISVFMMVVVSIMSIFYLKASHLGEQVNN